MAIRSTVRMQLLLVYLNDSRQVSRVVGTWKLVTVACCLMVLCVEHISDVEGVTAKARR